MAPATDAAPGATANLQLAPLHQAVICLRHSRHHLGVIRHAVFDLLLVGGVVPAMVGKKALRAQPAKVRCTCAGQQRGLVLGGTHPQWCIERLAQPVRQTHVIGVHVRDHHAQNRQTLHGAGHHLAPSFLRRRVGHAAIHHGPAVSNAGGRFLGVSQQPQIDVVQGKGQRHADPPNALCHLQSLARFGEGGAQRKAQGFFACQQIGGRHFGG